MRFHVARRLLKRTRAHARKLNRILYEVTFLDAQLNSDLQRNTGRFNTTAGQTYLIVSPRLFECYRDRNADSGTRTSDELSPTLSSYVYNCRKSFRSLLLSPQNRVLNAIPAGNSRRNFNGELAPSRGEVHGVDKIPTYIKRAIDARLCE